MNPIISNRTEPQPFLSDEERERFIQNLKKKYRACLNVILLIPSSCAICITFLAIGLIKIIFVMDGQCLSEKAPNETFNRTDMDMTLQNSDYEDGGYCRYLRLANHYQPQSVELLAAFVASGGIVRCINTAGLYRQVQTKSTLEEKQLSRWTLITIVIVVMTAGATGNVYKPMLHTKYPHIAKNAQGFYNICDVLSIIFFFSLIECGITFVSLALMNYFCHTDAELEKKFQDARRVRNNDERL